MNVIKKTIRNTGKMAKNKRNVPFSNSSKRFVLFVVAILYCFVIIYSVVIDKAVSEAILHSLEFIIIASICGVAVTDIFNKKKDKK